MKKSINFSEVSLWAIMLLPFVYLATIWNGLPETVPTHFNENGVADGWGSKSTLIWMPVALIFFTYLVMLVIPKIDPKKKLATMGKKYEQIKWIMVGLMVAISIMFIYSAKNGETGMSSNLLFAGMGIFYALIGNYFPAIKHNYFLGIRTPWTLENETVWKRTHRLAGGWWMVGGIIIVLSSLMLKSEFALPVFVTVTLVIALVPIVYSYLEFKKVSKSVSS